MMVTTGLQVILVALSSLPLPLTSLVSKCSNKPQFLTFAAANVFDGPLR
jgi:hypothetical protein